MYDYAMRPWNTVHLFLSYVAIPTPFISNGVDTVNTIINELKNLTDDECVPGGYTCGGEGGWRRVVYLNMSDPSTSWSLTIDLAGN